MRRKIFITCLLTALILFACGRDGLKNRKIFFGTPAGYAERLSAAISEAGGTAVSVPLIETVIPADNPDLDSLFMHVADYDYIAFSSRKAIEAFFEGGAEDIEKEVLAGIKFCAIGKDAELLEHYGVSAEIVPDESSPQGIVDALAARDDIAGRSVALIVPEVRGISEPNVVPDFISGLEKTGMKVSRVNAYRTGLAEIEGKDELVSDIIKGRFDIIAFTSTAEIEAFLLIIEDRSLPEGQLIACFGPYTAANAEDMGLEVDIIAGDYSSFSGFARAMSEYYSK
ncbi:MAG: uroporphyrinogen-III synthase [Bacteroidales bacterium]|nr:uroporphyrinogen-III synthase [Bacteroidales bacterium]